MNANHTSSLTLNMLKIKHLLAAGATAALIAISAPAHAADPVELPPGTFVVDQVGALTSAQENELEKTVSELQTQTGQSLYVVYVDKFTNPSDAQKWVGATANKRGLLSTDSILAIAVKDRKAQFESHSGGSIAKHNEKIFSTEIRPALSDSNWLGAGQAAARGITKAAQGDYTARATAPSAPVDLRPFMKALGIFFLALVIAAAAFFLIRWLRARAKRLARMKALEAEIKAEIHRASTLIIDLNTASAAAAEKLGFVEAEHGPEAAALAAAHLKTVESKMTDFIRFNAEQSQKQDVDMDVLDLWRANIMVAEKTLSGFEELDQVIAKYVEKIQKVKSNANAMLSDIAKELKSVAADQKRIGADKQFTSRLLEISLNSAREYLGNLDHVKDLLDKTAGLGNTPQGLQYFEMAQQAMANAEHNPGYREYYDEHLARIENVAKLERDIVEITQRAKKLAKKPRHEQLAPLADQTMQTCRQISERYSPKGSDITSFEQELRENSRPLLRAVRDAVDLENELAHAKRQVPVCIDEARTAVDKAVRYIRSHHEARARQNQLTQALGLIEAADAGAHGEDQRQALNHAKQGLELAKRVLKKAQQDVQDAERARRAADSARRRAASSYSSSSASSFGAGFGASSFSSGSSSGFGYGGSGGSFGSSSGGFDSGGAGGSF